MSRNVFVGHLPEELREAELLNAFRSYGRPRVTAMKRGYAFLEFETLKYAARAVEDMNFKNFLGRDLIVEFTKRHTTEYELLRATSMAATSDNLPTICNPVHSMTKKPFVMNAACRVLVHGLPPSITWKDLKKWGRLCGQIYFAGIDKESPDRGFIDYGTLATARYAVKTLDGRTFDGHQVQVTSGIPNNTEPHQRRHSGRSRSPRRRKPEPSCDIRHHRTPKPRSRSRSYHSRDSSPASLPRTHRASRALFGRRDDLSSEWDSSEATADRYRPSVNKARRRLHTGPYSP